MTFRRLRRVYTRLFPQRVLRRLRLAWLWTARLLGLPVSSPRAHAPRPKLARGRRPLQLTHVLLACDLNPDYLEGWPSVARAWDEIVGLQPLLVLVAPPEQVPPELAADPRVRVFDPIPGLATTFQAQSIRLLYPALVETEGAVAIGDVDMHPLRPSYFHGPLRKLDERFFVVYRDSRASREELNIAYNAARPETWADVFGTPTEEAVRSRLAHWGSTVPHDDRRGWPGWYADQRILYASLTSWGDGPSRLWLLDDDYTRYRNLNTNRSEVDPDAGLSDAQRRGVERRRYSDYSCLLPYRQHRSINDFVLELGLEAARTRRSG